MGLLNEYFYTIHVANTAKHGTATKGGRGAVTPPTVLETSMNGNNSESNKSDVPLAERPIADLPKINVEVEVEVPEEIWETAEERAEIGKERFNNGSSMEDYLLDQIRFDYNFVKESDT